MLRHLQKQNKRIPSIFNDRSTGSCICLRRHIYISHINNKTDTLKNDMRSSNTCDMYMCRLRHIHDPVLLSLKMEGIRFIFSGVGLLAPCSTPSYPGGPMTF